MESRSVNPFNRRSKWRSSFRGLPDSSPLLMISSSEASVRGFLRRCISTRFIVTRCNQEEKAEWPRTCQVRGIRSGTSPASNLRLRQCFSTSEDKGQRRASCVSDRAAQRRWRRLAEPVESLRLPENQNSVLLRVLSQTLPHTWTAAFCLHCPSVTGGL